MEKSKLDSSTLIIVFPLISILWSSPQCKILINWVLFAAYLDVRNDPFLNQYFILFFTNCLTLSVLYFSPNCCSYSFISFEISMLRNVAPDTFLLVLLVLHLDRFVHPDILSFQCYWNHHMNIILLFSFLVSIICCIFE